MIREVQTYLCLLICIAVASAIGAAIQGHSTDRTALLSFMAGITGDPQSSLGNWNLSICNCNWTGILCDKTTGRVVQLDLSGRSLSGTISPELAALSFLTVLDLSRNLLSGKIPVELCKLEELTQLSLSSNVLEGPIPPELGRLRRLVYLDLGSNRLSGDIPASLFCNCSLLQYVELSNNSLRGEIPLPDGCSLRDLRFLLLWSNYLVGSIPRAFSYSSKLEWFDVESNYLTGELPAAIISTMPRLKFLYLSYNSFTSHESNTNLAPFFSSLSNCTRLEELELAGNGLGGVIPSGAGDLPVALIQLNLAQNRITGPIPPSISNLVNLTYLNLSNNILNGSIPPDLSRLRRLERVYLSNNKLTGEIPSALGRIPRLGLLDLSRNLLSGTIPESLSSLSQLRRLLLHDNHLSGAIPRNLGDCINLEIIDLSHNTLTGEIPTGVAGLGSLKIYLNLSHNLLSGPLPLELSKMDMVLAVDISSNKLSGVLPPQLGSCVALEYLNLSHNRMEGHLPNSLGGLPYLGVLDLSSNELTGTLPESLSTSSSLKKLNLSFNGFSGVVSGEGVFKLLSVESFMGNPGLCGPISGMASCEIKKGRNFPILPVLLLTLVIIPCTVFLVGCPLVRRKSRRGPAPPPLFFRENLQEEREYPRISHRQLAEATGEFNPSNLIGSGRFGNVFKGALSDGTQVAVKVFDQRSSGGSGSGGGGEEMSGDFRRECRVLRRTRHRNLIRIITACSGPDFKALVLPLMQNGSLESHLYPQRRLDLVQIVSICSDVAEGMAYLHHYSPVRVVHCDLKPSNVLLDEHLNGLVSDFGISRLVKGPGNGGDEAPGSPSCNSLTGMLCGSFGYIAPGMHFLGFTAMENDSKNLGFLLPAITETHQGSDRRSPTQCRIRRGRTALDGGGRLQLWSPSTGSHHRQAPCRRSPPPWPDSKGLGRRPVPPQRLRRRRGGAAG